MKIVIHHSPLFASLSPRAAGDVERALMYYAASTLNETEGEQCHATMMRHAIAGNFDSNTGGWVWLSYTVDVIGVESAPVLIVAGIDACSVYALPEGTDPTALDIAEAAGVIWDMCGDDDAVKLATVYMEDDGSNPTGDFIRHCEARKAAAQDDAGRMFWHRLLGSVRKAAAM